MEKKFETLSSKIVYENPWLKVYEYEIRRRGSMGVYSVVEREHSVITIPLSPSKRTVVVNQYRYPTNTNSWELPMGGIGTAETKEQAVERELREETQLHATKYEMIGEYYAVPGLTNQKVSVFLVKVADSELDQAFTPTDADDITESKILPLDDVYHMVRRGEITDGFTLVALLYLRLYLDSQRQPSDRGRQ